MSAPAEVDVDALDLQAMFEQRYPGWRFTRTAVGWWAVKGVLVREQLHPRRDVVLHATSPASLMVLLDEAERRAA